MHLGYKEKVLPKVINVAKLNINNEIKKVNNLLEQIIKSNDTVPKKHLFIYCHLEAKE